MNVSNNNLTTLSGLENLSALQVLIANDNLLSNLEDVTKTLEAWHFLRRLSLIGNLVTEDRKYRDSVIVASKRLGKYFICLAMANLWKKKISLNDSFPEILDNKPILNTTRKFIEKLTELKKSRNGKLPENVYQKKEVVRKDKDTKTVQFTRVFESESNFPNLAEILPPAAPSDLHPAWKLRKIFQIFIFIANFEKQN